MLVSDCSLRKGKQVSPLRPFWWLSPPSCPVGSMSYDTESKSRNILASPLGEEGHEVAKGWTRERMIMILLFYVLSPFAQGAADWRSG